LESVKPGVKTAAWRSRKNIRQYYQRFLAA
jgi:hypothetical protein